jgi:hypothetical protein
MGIHCPLNVIIMTPLRTDHIIDGCVSKIHQPHSGLHGSLAQRSGKKCQLTSQLDISYERYSGKKGFNVLPGTR